MYLGEVVRNFILDEVLVYEIKFFFELIKEYLEFLKVGYVYMF